MPLRAALSGESKPVTRVRDNLRYVSIFGEPFVNLCGIARLTR